MIHSFFIALSMYSRLPVPHTAWQEEDMRYVMCFFPLIGLAIGLLVYGWAQLAAFLSVGPALFAGIACALPVAVTGGIHLDGFCDTIDALGSRQPVERKLEILKDSNSGAFAVIGCCLYFLLLFCLWQELEKSSSVIIVVAVGYVLSRSLSGLSVVCFPLAKNSGLLAMFSNAADKRRTAFVLCLYGLLCATLLLLINPMIGVGVLLAAGCVFAYYRWMSAKEFGGTTGDLAGWFLQVCELAMLFAAVAVPIIAGL